MKRLLVLLAILVSAMTLQASSWSHDFEDAVELAKKLHKPIIMMYSSKS